MIERRLGQLSLSRWLSEERTDGRNGEIGGVDVDGGVRELLAFIRPIT